MPSNCSALPLERLTPSRRGTINALLRSDDETATPYRCRDQPVRLAGPHPRRRTKSTACTAASTRVLLTHAHPDHLCGLLGADGQMAYPNARVWIHRAELAYWQDPVSEAKATDSFKPLFGMARKALAPYIAAG